MSPVEHAAISVDETAAIPDENASDDTRRSGWASLNAAPSSAFIFASSRRTVGLPRRV